MKKLLYITANSKPEELSSSKTVGRRVVDSFVSKDPDIQVEEIDLFAQNIPCLKYNFFENRNTIIHEQARNELPEEDKTQVEEIVRLCDQFISADIYVLAVPMWNLSFPSVVKKYLDCIIQTGKTISFHNNKPSGLLDNKTRSFIYVQSSGASLPWIIGAAMNKGLNYIRDIMKFIGISQFEELLVDGTGTTEEERQEAINSATEEIDKLVENIL